MEKLFLITFLLVFSNAYSQDLKPEKVDVSGIVIDAVGHNGLEHVGIFYNDVEIATTDNRGYFSGQFDVVLNNTPIIIYILKDGYGKITLKERWHPMNFRRGINIVAGLKTKGDTVAQSFVDAQPGRFSEGDPHKRLESVLTKQVFEIALDKLRDGNDKVLFDYQNEHYVISDTGWLKVESLENTLIINDRNKIKVGDVNNYLKRSQIKDMTPDSRTGQILMITTY